tara:strand:- start:954 stop:1571 length:618 start_codon:yes stop_codon:yes gene_type:complete
MSDQYTEEEDKLISWFKENFKNMLIGIIVGISFVLGLNYYSDTTLNKQYEISLKFEQALISYQEKKYADVLDFANDLTINDPENVYTSLINLYAAKIHHDNKDYEKALGSLNLIINNSNSIDILDIANLRSARILIFLKRYDEAKNYILAVDDYMEKAISTELLGDIEYYRNNFKQAKDYYLDSLDNEMTPNKRKIIENKINSIN